MVVCGVFGFGFALLLSVCACWGRGGCLFRAFVVKRSVSEPARLCKVTTPDTQLHTQLRTRNYAHTQLHTHNYAHATTHTHNYTHTTTHTHNYNTQLHSNNPPPPFLTRVHRHRDVERAQHDAAVKVDVGVEVAPHEVVVLQGDALELDRDLEERVVAV